MTPAEVCDHATKHAGGWLMCEATGQHSIHWGTYATDAGVKESHRWTADESMRGTVRECCDTREAS
jgi:hypothetical protein